MSTLVYGITRFVTRQQERLGGDAVVIANFMDAYTQLRRAYRDGDLRIHLSVESVTPLLPPESGGGQ